MNIHHEINDNFRRLLVGLSDEKKRPAMNLIFSKFSERVAHDSKFYQNDEAVKQVAHDLYNRVDITDPFLKALVDIQCSPYSAFAYILTENFSDVILHGDGYVASNSKDTYKVTIPDYILGVYRLFLDTFVKTVIFLSNVKFDPSHAIVDTEVGVFRFNLVHESLTVKKVMPLMIIRKQTLPSDIISVNNEQYIQSLGCTQRQMDTINKYAVKGNFVLFGETGSGKTTLLRYMANYHLEDKRNLCTVEDTSELNIPVPIALLTNRTLRIKDLFTALLRENPSTIIIGETRTDEIVDILEAALTINVGTTIHANSFYRAIQRIIFMSMGRGINSQEIKDLINASVDCFIFMDGLKVREIWEHVDHAEPNIYNAYCLI
jgi:type IV secretory pathway ATPase VirB11/archaellum biosynthesis ATPase